MGLVVTMGWVIQEVIGTKAGISDLGRKGGGDEVFWRI